MLRVNTNIYMGKKKIGFNDLDDAGKFYSEQQSAPESPAEIYQVNGIKIQGNPGSYENAVLRGNPIKSDYLPAGTLYHSMHDADTVSRKNMPGMRMSIIDAPELNQEWGKEALEHTRELFSELPATTRLKVDYFGKDKYDRDLVEIYMPDGEPVSHKLIKAGMVMGTMGKDLQSDALLKKAQDLKMGMFNPIHPLTDGNLRNPYIHRQNAKGSNKQNQQVLVDKKNKAFDAYKNASHPESIYDQFVKAGINPEYEFREQIFRYLGHGDYKGTDKQNTQMLNDIHNGKLTKNTIIDAAYAQ